MKFNPVSYVVLGLIGLRGPSTPYQLKRSAGRSINYFWSFPHSQLYSEPKRLAAAGLLSEEVEEEGRRRKLYDLTEKGRTALKQWLRTHPSEAFEMRDMAVLQLFFSDFMECQDLEELARKQVDVYCDRLEVYKEILEIRRGSQASDRRMAPLNLGFRLVETCIEFWEEIARNPPASEPAGSDKYGNS